jgi:ribonuclease P protein component
MRTPGDVTGPPTTCTTHAPRHADAGFARERRIVRNADYQRIFSSGHRSAGRYVVLWTDEGPAEVPRAGVIASKRTFRRAVDRARAKRLLREAFRLNREQLVCHRDCVLVARRAILHARCCDVAQDLLTVARRCRVLRRPVDRNT